MRDKIGFSVLNHQVNAVLIGHRDRRGRVGKVSAQLSAQCSGCCSSDAFIPENIWLVNFSNIKVLPEVLSSQGLIGQSVDGFRTAERRGSEFRT